MIRLQVADLVLIAGRVLALDTETALDRLDVPAAEAALADAASLGRDDPARAAAALLAALLRGRALPRGNEQVALVATAQFLALNGFRVDLDPPEKTQALVADLVAGRLEADDLADWLAPRLSLCEDADPDQPDPEYTCGRQPMLSRWLPTRRRTPRFKIPRRSRVKDPFHRFTDRARTVVVLAQDEARGLGHNYIGTEHVLLGLIDEGDGVAAKALQTLGVTGDAVRSEVEEIIGRGADTPTGHIPLTPRAKKVIAECALREAFQLGHNYVGTEHLLLGLLREGQGVAAQVLVKLGANHASVRSQVLRLLHGHEGQEPQAAPPDLRYFDEQLARVRRSKEAAVDAGDFDTAATLRDAEEQLLAEMRQRVKQWLAAVDPVALVEETHRLRGEVERLRTLLRRHGIEPDDGSAPAAQAGG